MKEKSKEEQGKRLEKIRNETPRTLLLWGNIPRLATASRAGGCSAAGMRTLFCNCVAEQG